MMVAMPGVRGRLDEIRRRATGENPFTATVEGSEYRQRHQPAALDEHWWAKPVPRPSLWRPVIAIAMALGGAILAGMAIN